MSAQGPLGILSERLEQRRSQALERHLLTLGPATGPRVTHQGREYLLLASNDYLGLSQHPELARAASQAALEHGCGSGASRLVSGTLAGHSALEERIAAFKGTPAALFFATGYMANLGVISGLAGRGDYIVSDELNHASIVDACRLSRATVKVYAHGDVAQAESLLAQAPAGALRLLVTDGVFSMDGDLASLPQLLEAARRQQALLVVDDAHATGVWGASGRGSLEHFGLGHDPQVVMVGTFSKALGGLGGFAAGAPEVIATLVNQARSLLYTTAPPPAQVAAAARALELVDEEPWRRTRVHELADNLRQGLRGLGLSVLSEAGPIIPLLVGQAERALHMSQALWEKGLLVPAMRPPTVPEGLSRLRLTVTAAHTEQDIEQALAALSALAHTAQEAGI